VDFHFTGDSVCLPLNRYSASGEKTDNISAVVLKEFQVYYKDSGITSLDIFFYVYAVLHHPIYQERYKLNIKRELPRIPFYADFRQWAHWGKSLIDLHVNYENAEPYDLQRIEHPLKRIPSSANPKPRLIANKNMGTIELDTMTTLAGVPDSAWQYKFGSRTALELVLEYYKERKKKDATIREKFNTYCFANHKEHAIQLLQRVCTVSVETMRIIGEMPGD
jgi:predicted helicase